MKRGGFEKLSADVLHNQYNLCSDHFDRAQFINDRKEILVNDCYTKVLIILKYYTIHINHQL